MSIKYSISRNPSTFGNIYEGDKLLIRNQGDGISDGLARLVELANQASSVAAGQPVNMSLVDELERLLAVPVNTDKGSAGYWTNFGISLAIETVRHRERESIDRWKLAKWLYDFEAEVDTDGVQLRDWESREQKLRDAYYMVAGDCLEEISDNRRRG